MIIEPQHTAELNLINSLLISTFQRMLEEESENKQKIFTCIKCIINTFIRFKFVRALPFYDVVKSNSF